MGQRLREPFPFLLFLTLLLRCNPCLDGVPASAGQHGGSGSRCPEGSPSVPPRLPRQPGAPPGRWRSRLLEPLGESLGPIGPRLRGAFGDGSCPRVFPRWGQLGQFPFRRPFGPGFPACGPDPWWRPGSLTRDVVFPSPRLPGSQRAVTGQRGGSPLRLRVFFLFLCRVPVAEYLSGYCRHL